MKDELVLILIVAAVVLFWALLIVTIVLINRKKRAKASGAAAVQPARRPAPKPVRPEDYGLTAELLDRILERVAEKTRRETLEAKLLTEPEPGLFDSKLGGLPYWPADKPYPKDRDGKPLALLAQIDLAGLPETALLPRDGLLQFFILPDDCYGLEFPVKDDQNGYRVVFHETVDRSVTEASVKAMGLPTSFDSDCELPVCGQFLLRFRKVMTHIDADDERFDRELRLAAEEFGVTLPEDFPLYRVLGDETFTPWAGINAGTRMLGYPFFVQGDPREADSPYDTLLFQSDSWFEPDAVRRAGTAPKREVIWGDAGVGNFFIRSEDLLAGRFDRIFYTWDCG